MSRRSEQLLAIASDFLKQHDEWIADANRKDPDDSYWDSVTSLIESFADGDIPAESRALADAVNRFQDEADLFEDRDDERELYPPAAFWDAIGGIRRVVEAPARRELPPLESIKELCALPYMQLVQVANMYGFIDRRGNPMPRLVQMELDAPGSVIGPDAKGKGLIDGRDWKDPRLAEIEAKEGAAARNADAITYAESAKEMMRAKKQRSAKEAAKCPESARELWEQGVSATQAAKMLKEKEADVDKQFKEWTAARDFNRKVWDLQDKGVPIPDICRQVKAGPDKVQVAIDARADVGAGCGAGRVSESAVA